MTSIRGPVGAALMGALVAAVLSRPGAAQPEPGEPAARAGPPGIAVGERDNVVSGELYPEGVGGVPWAAPPEQVSNYVRNHVLDPQSPPLPDSRVPVPSQPLDAGPLEDRRIVPPEEPDASADYLLDRDGDGVISRDELVPIPR